jgi:hypothetical protein
MPAHVFTIGPYTVPGILQSVEVPDRALNWQVTQGSAGGIGAATIWRGVKLDEGGIVITTLITDASGNVEQDADEAARLWGGFIDLVHPQAIAKPPTWQVAHPLLSAQRPRITQAAHSKNKLALFDKSKLAWLGSLVLIEYKPLKIVRPAAPDPAQLEDKQVTPQNDREAYALQLSERIRNGT